MIVSIRTKLFIAIFLACSLAVGGLLGITLYHVKRDFLSFRNDQERRSLSQLESRLTEYYQAYGQWDELHKNSRVWRELARGSLFPLNDGDETLAPPPAPQTRLTRTPREIGGLPPVRPYLQQRIDRYIERIVLLDDKHHLLQGNPRLPVPGDLYPLVVDGKTVGYLGLHPRRRLTEKGDIRFAERLQRNLWISGLLALSVTALASLLLARHLGRPIQALRHGARQLADGDYALRMQPHGSDELAQLTRDFNQLASRLQQNEQSRKQWIADIAHELRTPLAILRGEVEALQDGINQPDAATLASLHQEVSHLQRLVNDLYDLSMSDSGALNYRMESADLAALLRETLALHGGQLQEQQLQVDASGLGSQPLYVHGDPQRLQQLFKNLLENSLRYTDKPGQLRISTQTSKSRVEIRFQDSPPGVPDESLPRLFERLYRVEGSRNRATGGAGIGLSICRNIVEAHNGDITAAHSPLGGLEIRISLPTES